MYFWKHFVWEVYEIHPQEVNNWITSTSLWRVFDSWWMNYLDTCVCNPSQINIPENNSICKYICKHVRYCLDIPVSIFLWYLLRTFLKDMTKSYAVEFLYKYLPFPVTNVCDVDSDSDTWSCPGPLIRCVKITSNETSSVDFSLTLMFNHLLESSWWDDSNKWTNIGFGEEIGILKR